MGQALVDGVSEIVVVLNDLPVVSSTEAWIGLACPATVVGNCALGDPERASYLRLGLAGFQHPQHRYPRHYTNICSHNVRMGQPPKALFFALKDAVRDSPIGSDARFWSGRLGFESLSRSLLEGRYATAWSAQSR